jgi:hypothetical protein
MKRKREPAGMPPEYVKGPGKKGELHPHWRKSFPDDEEDADGRGKVEEGLPGHGLWRRVPGFWMILASEDGNVMTVGASKVRKLTQGKKHYFAVGCNNTPEQVHNLVCRAFHGRPNIDQKSVDHIDVDNSNNCKTNLRWATPKQQTANRRDNIKVKSTREPCIVWECGTAIDCTKRRFDSANDAQKAIGFHHGALSDVLNGERENAVGADGKHYTGYWDRNDKDFDGEEWKVAVPEKLRVSNHGRIQTKHPTGKRWGPKRFQERSNKKDYLTVRINGKKKGVHVLVGSLFFVGPRPHMFTDWHHIDEDKTNNAIWNLSPVTRKVNAEECNHANERPVLVWEISNPNKKVSYKNANRAAQELGVKNGALYAVLKGYNGAKSVSARGEKKVWYAAMYANKVA